MKRLLVALIGLALALQFCTEAEAAMTSEHKLVRKMNAVRSGRNLKLSASLSTLAERHSHAMARRGGIFHTANLGAKVQNWNRLGENVGVGSNVRQLHRAFMHSAYHRANILGAWRQVGVGVTRSHGRMWVTVIFKA